MLLFIVPEKSDDTKEVIRSQNSKHRQCNSQNKKEKRKTIVQKTQQRKHNIEKHEPQLKTEGELR